MHLSFFIDILFAEEMEEAMITASIIQTSINELKTITKVDLTVMDGTGMVVATTCTDMEIDRTLVVSFVDSPADSQTVAGQHYIKVMDGNAVQYVLVASGEYENVFMIAKIAVSQLNHLLVAYKEKFDKNIFFQNLILDNLLLVDIYNRAKKLRIAIEESRLVFLIQIKSEQENDSIELLRSLFSVEAGDYVTSVDEHHLILIKSMEDGGDYERAEEIACTIVDMLNSEAMISVQVSYGTIVEELKEVSKSYKEAKMALDVSKIFCEAKTVVSYNSLGIGRLIYQLPVNLCKMFIGEVFGDKVLEGIDEETLCTIDQFFANNLNVSETSRQLYIHRNTLVYRIEKLEKSTGLDIRTFDDALTFKIALMVVKYMNYMERNK